GSDSARRSGGRSAMTVPSTSFPARGRTARRFFGLLSLAAMFSFLLAACSNTGVSTADSVPPPSTPIEPISAIDPPSAKPKEVPGGRGGLFGGRPRTKKPDAVFALPGQPFGSPQPGGCSRPQTGGLERRAMLIKSLEAKGWPVAGVDLGDIHAEKPPQDK